MTINNQLITKLVDNQKKINSQDVKKRVNIECTKEKKYN